MMTRSGHFQDIIEWLSIQLSHAPEVYVGEWQAMTGVPQERTIELQDVSFETEILPLEHWQRVVKPNLPWAEDHFQERVSGRPLNPPPSHEWWPYAQKSNTEHRKDGKFSHTYPERIWARSLLPDGIRYPTGDLASLLELLSLRPGTRQAYLPIWFPEDLGAANAKERVPCTLGYHFLIRNGEMKIVYYIRSCDFYRHFRDDVYMAGRLAQWIAERLESVQATKLVMHISSMHIFSPEREKIHLEALEMIDRNMLKVR